MLDLAPTERGRLQMRLEAKTASNVPADVVDNFMALFEAATLVSCHEIALANLEVTDAVVYTYQPRNKLGFKGCLQTYRVIRERGRNSSAEVRRTLNHLYQSSEDLAPQFWVANSRRWENKILLAPSQDLREQRSGLRRRRIYARITELKQLKNGDLSVVLEPTVPVPWLSRVRAERNFMAPLKDNFGEVVRVDLQTYYELTPGQRRIAWNQIQAVTPFQKAPAAEVLTEARKILDERQAWTYQQSLAALRELRDDNE